MAQILILLAFMGLLFLIKTTIKDIVSKKVIYCFLGYWMVSLLLSTLNLFNLYNVTITSYIYLLLNVISIVVGFCSLNIKHRSNCNTEMINFEVVFSSKIFWMLFAVVLLFGIETLRTQFAVLLYYTTGNIKVDPMGLLFNGSKFKYYFFNLFCTPFYYICMGLFAFLLLYARSKKKTMLALFLLVFVYSFIGGGRVSIMFIAFYVLMFYFWGDRIHLSNGNIKPIHITFKTIVFSIIAVCVLFFGMTIVTALGQTGFSDSLDLESAYTSLMEQVVVYSVGPFRAFDYAIQHPNIYFHDYYYGRASFCGFDYVVSLICGVFNCWFVPINYVTQSVLQETTIFVGKDIPFNYAYTNTMYSYYDMGVFGIIFFGFLFGRFYRYVIKLCYVKSSVFYFLLSCFTFYILMHTVFSNYFNKSFTVPLILTLLILGKLNFKKNSL